MPLSTTLDSVGVIARSVADCAALFDVMRDRPSPRRFDIPVRRIRLGVVGSYVQDGVANGVAEAFDAAVGKLAAAGIGIEQIAIPELAEIPEMMREASFPAAEAAAWHSALLGAGLGCEYDPRVLIRIRAGETMTATAYVKLVERRRWLIETVAARSAGLDALVWPTVPFTAPTIDSLADDAAYHAANGLALRNSSVTNLLDGCAISIPCPGEGAPVGLTLAAANGRDDHLLSVAATAQSILKGP